MSFAGEDEEAIDDDENIKFCVKQSYPSKVGHQHESGQLRKMAMEESHRVITPEGKVIKFMQNGSIIVSFV